jgi:hypothetical protein
MRLEGIAPVWDEEHNPSAGLERPDHLADRETVILYVFKDFMAEDQVEGGSRKGDRFASCIDNMGGILSCFGGAFEVIFQPNHDATKREEVFHIHPDAATVFKDTALDAFSRGADDQVQPTLLSCPPDVRRFPAQSSFIQIAYGHVSP